MCLNSGIHVVVSVVKVMYHLRLIFSAAIITNGRQKSNMLMLLLFLYVCTWINSNNCYFRIYNITARNKGTAQISFDQIATFGQHQIEKVDPVGARRHLMQAVLHA